MASFTRCGSYDDGNGTCDLVADVNTGEVILVSDLLGNCYLSEITALNVLRFASEEAEAKIRRHFEADGVILTDKYLITLKDGVASYRNAQDYSAVEHTIKFDTDMVCERAIHLIEDED